MADDRDNHYFALAERWANTLAQDDPRRRSMVVTRPNSPGSREFLDAWEAQSRPEDVLNRIEAIRW